MPQATVAAIVTQEDCPTKILLTRRNIEPFKGQWCLPGGHIDHRELAQDAIVREVKEETGLDFDPLFFNYFDEIVPEPKPKSNLFDQLPTVLRRVFRGQAPPPPSLLDIHAVVLVFDGPGKGTLHLQKEEVEAIKWFSLDEARTIPLAFTHNKILDAYTARFRSVSDTLKSELLTEYAALRDELLKHLARRYQILIFTLTAFGAFATVGLKDLQNPYPLIFLLYPIFSVFLMQAWTHADVRVGQIGEYLRKHVERRIEGIGWETHLRSEYANPEMRFFRGLVERYAAGIFVVTQVLSMLLALSLQIANPPDPPLWLAFGVLLAFDFIALWLTWRLACTRRKRYYGPRVRKAQSGP